MRSFKAIAEIVNELSELLSFYLDVLSPKGGIIWSILISKLWNILYQVILRHFKAKEEIVYDLLPILLF